jgi:hypothetical protein
MSTSLHELKNGAPAKCAHCGQPFRIKDQQVECWLQIPVHRGQSFRRIADSIPVIADSF